MLRNNLAWRHIDVALHINENAFIFPFERKGAAEHLEGGNQMSFASLEDSKRLQNEMPWEAREVPATVYEMLSITSEKFPDRPAVSYQLLSGPDDKAETLT